MVLQRYKGGGGGGFTREANFCRPSRLKSFRIPLCTTQDRLYIYTVNDSLLPIRIVAIKMSYRATLPGSVRVLLLLFQLNGAREANKTANSALQCPDRQPSPQKHYYYYYYYYTCIYIYIYIYVYIT